MNVRQYLDQSRKHYDVLMHLETHSAMGMARATERSSGADARGSGR
jgi:hypothetical protein